MRRTQKFWWVAAINFLGAALSTTWVLYLVYDAAGFWRSVLAAIPLGLILRFAGSAPLFAVAASLLCFHYSVVGLWLPLLSYCSGGIGLFLHLRTNRQVDEMLDLDVTHATQGPSLSADQLNYEAWTESLAGVVEELGAENPEIEIRVYTYVSIFPDPQASRNGPETHLFTVRPNDLQTTVTRLRDEFGGGQFLVRVLVKGNLRRQFVLLVGTPKDRF